jgi:hypothetical protein
MNVIVRFTEPDDGDAYEAYWLDLGKLVRSYATHGIDAEFGTEWYLHVDDDELESLRDDLAELGKRHGQAPAVVIDDKPTTP